MGVTKRILVCSDSKTHLDRMHTWLHDADRNYVVRRGDGLDRSQAVYERSTYHLVISDLQSDSSREWILSIEAHQTVLHIVSFPLPHRHYLTKPLEEKKFLDEVGKLLGD